MAVFTLATVGPMSSGVCYHSARASAPIRRLPARREAGAGTSGEHRGQGSDVNELLTLRDGAETAAPCPMWQRLRTGLELAVLGAALVGAYMLVARVWRLTESDVAEYFAYAHSFWLGSPPFHALPKEYPPLAILPFTLTLLPALQDHTTVFAVWMGALVLLGFVGFLRFASHRSALAYAVYLVLGATATLLARFDLVPALVTVGALWAAQRRRFGLAYLLLAAGILFKLYPAFLVPIVAIAQWQAEAKGSVALAGASPGEVVRRIARFPATAQVARGVARCMAPVAVLYAGAFLLGPDAALSTFRYASARPIQVESVPATLLWLGTFFGFHAQPNVSFSSHNFVGPLDTVLKPLSALALVAGCLWVYWRQTHGKLTLDRAFLACLCVIVATNKLLSPQYFIWLLPIAAAVDGFDILWLALCVLSTYEFPIGYHDLLAPSLTLYAHSDYSWNYLAVVAARNGLLVFLTLRSILRRPRSTVEQGTGAGDGTQRQGTMRERGIVDLIRSSIP
jgi:hypothetical protein